MGNLACVRASKQEFDLGSEGGRTDWTNTDVGIATQLPPELDQLFKNMMRDFAGDKQKGGGEKENTQNRSVKEAYRLLYEEEVQSRLVSGGPITH